MLPTFLLHQSTTTTVLTSDDLVALHHHRVPIRVCLPNIRCIITMVTSVSLQWTIIGTLNSLRASARLKDSNVEVFSLCVSVSGVRLNL